MDEDGPRELPDVFQVLDQVVEAVPLQGAHIGEPQLLEDRPGDEEGLERLLHLAGELEHLLADARDRFQEGLDLVLDPVHRLAGHDPVEIGGEGADVRGDAHLVVVEDDDQVLLAVSGPVEPLEGHPGGHRPVADDGDDPEILALQAARLGHPRRRGDGGPAVPHVEDVVGALLPLREAADPPLLPEGVEALLPAGDDLVGIGLVSHVPDQAVPGRVEDVVEGERQLHRPQGGGQMAALPGDGLDHHLPDLLREALELRQAEAPDVLGEIDSRQDALLFVFSHRFPIVRIRIFRSAVLPRRAASFPREAHIRAFYMQFKLIMISAPGYTGRSGGAAPPGRRKRPAQ